MYHLKLCDRPSHVNISIPCPSTLYINTCYGDIATGFIANYYITTKNKHKFERPLRKSVAWHNLQYLNNIRVLSLANGTLNITFPTLLSPDGICF